jgi:uncharacterized membrane protein YhaH (DUF805 family)
MKKYYYLEGGDRKGPFTLSELKLVKGFSAETKVWYQGIADWTRAGDIPELSSEFAFAFAPNGGNQKLFACPFLFKGRIRRLEYGLSTIISSFIGLVLLIFGSVSSLVCFSDGAMIMLDNKFMENLACMSVVSTIIFCLIYAGISWFNIAQATKRCHDIGKSGWWQLIPFFNIYLYFPEGKHSANKYGFDPKSA